jgi:hypothetical protein
VTANQLVGFFAPRTANRRYRTPYEVKTMQKKIEQKDRDSLDPMNLDPTQLEELDKLIDSLRKEIIFPRKATPVPERSGTASRG